MLRGGHHGIRLLSSRAAAYMHALTAFSKRSQQQGLFRCPGMLLELSQAPQISLINLKMNLCGIKTPGVLKRAEGCLLSPVPSGSEHCEALQCLFAFPRVKMHYDKIWLALPSFPR